MSGPPSTLENPSQHLRSLLAAIACLCGGDEEAVRDGRRYVLLTSVPIQLKPPVRVSAVLCDALGASEWSVALYPSPQAARQAWGNLVSGGALPVWAPSREQPYAE